MLGDVTTPDHWTVDYRPGGWARARGDSLTVYLRLGSEGGEGHPRLRIYLATVTADGPITEAIWRSVPLAEIEMHMALLSGVTSPEIDRTVEALGKPVEIAGYSVDALERYFAETEPLPVQGHFPGRTTVNGEPLAERFTLTRPADGRLTDEFLRNMAGLYLATVEARKAPAPVVAEAAGVSVRTVHGWVAEARRRGFLPPAVRGKAG
jgi:hypothetical protein